MTGGGCILDYIAASQINFLSDRPRRFQPQFSLSELVPEESERVFTQFSVAGLELLDSLPPLAGTATRDEDVKTAAPVQYVTFIRMI